VRAVTYYSEGVSAAGSNVEGLISRKYFPYYVQKNYQAPFVWVQFDVTPNTLVNIECRALANNIEQERQNKRGMTKFTLFIKNK